MANIQKYFEIFHDNIRIDYDSSEPLREKREIVLRRLRKYLKDNSLPGFKEILQGSYAMKTGVKPIAELDYDIDVGIRFAIEEADFKAQDIRKWVGEALKGHTEKVLSKGPCDRVVYAEGYHVDLVSYAVWDDAVKVEQFRLAHKNNGWRPADPLKLMAYIEEAMKQYSGTEDAASKTNQFRRCVRYLRRWIDVAIPKESKAKPTGLAFVLLASKCLQCTKSWDGKSDDRQALQNMMQQILGTYADRIAVDKPTPEGEDMFARLSNAEMGDLKERIRKLKTALEQARDQADPVIACEILHAQFGEDFPVPEPEDTAKKTSSPAIVPSSSSAI